MRMPEPPYPLHESVRDLIDPEYAAFYNEHIIDKQQVHYQPIAVSRASGILIPGAGPMIPVGKTQDLAIKRQESKGPALRVRCFTPAAEKEPDGGWPVLLYYHGGGWVLGNLDTENVVCTNICARANCVVVTTDYRLAPENPFPAAVDDSWETVLWIHGEGRELLNVDTSRIGVGGSSAGGNLAAIMAHRSVARNLPPLRVQLLNVPVMDNTADVSNNRSYKDYEHTPALPASKMIWYRHHYLPNESVRSNPEASPLMYPDDAPTWDGLPHAIVVVGELDVLREEGEQYAAKLKRHGVSTDLHVMQRQPHPFLAMDGVLEAGRQAITYMVEGCKVGFS
ncbi:lipase [Coccidioides immitis RS]|uniref:Lipase n=2 Tax=Coccidioides immitis TaxID=5501 RepID=J3K955_COCIM|nr:lipase [Coccidioides immitis RS]EAS31404.3 lipase [Coccidioides immitis RS]KMP04047.1 lipase 2 [Coccidioides immitis RMSCC 2394]TPX24200.1 hypothetical protein DIZ76_013543 [Coccidioides immitis]